MNATFVTATALACIGGLAIAQETPRAVRPASSSRLVGQVVSTDARARTLTVRTGASTDGALTLRVSSRAAGQLARYNSGDWVELTCSAPATPTPTVQAGQASTGPAPVPVGTGARPGTGTTGVGTTGTGISGTGTPAPGTTPGSADAQQPAKGSEGGSCGVVTRIGKAAAPAEQRPR